ncbi:hypothetical protein BJX64DRAFT_295358 [Aspergillus heterothallicus]
MSSSESLLDITPFREARDKFLSHLTPEQAQEFRNTTVEQLEETIWEIHTEHMIDMRRVQGFFSAMRSFALFTKAHFDGPEYMGLIWGPVKCTFRAASSYAAALYAMLEIYEEIGRNLPGSEYYNLVREPNAHLVPIVHLIYAGMLSFLKKTLKFFNFEHTGILISL